VEDPRAVLDVERGELRGGEPWAPRQRRVRDREAEGDQAARRRARQQVEEVADRGRLAAALGQATLEVGEDERWYEPANTAAVDGEDPETVGVCCGIGGRARILARPPGLVGPIRFRT
jgi:hypothetical protein